MSIQVVDDRKIIVKVPLGTPTFVAENFIREKKDWITKQPLTVVLGKERKYGRPVDGSMLAGPHSP